MKNITVAVTGLNAIDSPGPGISVIRALKESTHFQVRIVGLIYENLEPGIYMKNLVDKSYQIPYPTTGYENLLKRLKYIHGKESIDVVIPNFDAELYSFIRLAPILREMGIKTLLPTMEQFNARQKGNLVEFGKKYGITIPAGAEVNSAGELGKALKEFDFPVVVKGKFYEAYLAYNSEQVQSYFYKISAKWGTPVILQEHIKGQDLNVTALGDGKGNMIGAVPMRKTFLTDAGKAWAGISISDEDLFSMTRTVVTKTKWAGGMELEMIKDEKTGTVYLIEINPRFPAWVFLAVGCGQNHPEALVRIALGEDVQPFEKYEVGKMFIRYSWDMICDLKDFEKIATFGEL
jgi:carbamoyl-phosphate synthase large subunit